MIEELPYGCTFPEDDWHILAGYWHPVAYSDEINDSPYAAKLLDTKLVLYRNNHRSLVAANNQCPHRGASLSRGWLENGMLVCAYHGLKYNSKGECTRIPAAGPDAKIPAKLCLKTYFQGI